MSYEPLSHILSLLVLFAEEETYFWQLDPRQVPMPSPLILSLLSQLTYNANELRFVCFAFAFAFLCPLSLLLRIAGLSCPLN